MWPHASFKTQDNLCPAEWINRAEGKRLLTELGEVESCSRGRSDTRAGGKGRVGRRVLQAPGRVGPEPFFGVFLRAKLGGGCIPGDRDQAGMNSPYGNAFPTADEDYVKRKTVFKMGQKKKKKKNHYTP